MDNREGRMLFGWTAGIWAGAIIVTVLLALVVAGITIWWNYNVQPAVDNSQRHLQTCQTEFIDSQKANIVIHLNAIANEKSELANPNFSSEATAIKSQQTENVRSIYDALDKSSCSRAQIINDMPELHDFFATWPTRP